MPIYNEPPPPPAFVHIVNENEKKKQSEILSLLNGAPIRVSRYNVFLEDFLDWGDDDDDDDDEEDDV